MYGEWPCWRPPCGVCRWPNTLHSPSSPQSSATGWRKKTRCSSWSLACCASTPPRNRRTPPTPWPSRYAMRIPHRRCWRRKSPAFEVQLIPQRNMTWAVLPFLLVLGVPLRAAQSGTQAQIRFTYENPKLQPPKYVFTVAEDGSGHFQSEGGGPTDGQSISSEPQDRPIHISKTLREFMFTSARKNKLFALSCDDGGKNIAFQGNKTLEYDGPEGKGSCMYNWSKNAQIDKLSDQFEAIAATLDEGGKLQRQYEHGRLSLDSEIQVLEQLVHDGRAIELENIAPILQTLAGDEAVLQRVQRRARALLAEAKSD